MKTIYPFRNRELPKVLKDSAAMRDASGEEISNFQSRMRYIEEMVQKISDWLSGNDPDTSFVAFVDRVELDLGINLSVRGNSKEISWWVVHSSWSRELTSAELFASLTPDIISGIENASISINCSLNEFATWLQRQNDLLAVLLNRFFEAETLANSIGSLLAMDVCLETMLLGVSRQRLNPRLFD